MASANTEQQIDARPRFRSSIVLKLALFVALLVILSTTAASVAGYIFTRQTLRDQIHRRLSAVASDRQKFFKAYIERQHERLALVASRTRLRQLVELHARKGIGHETFVVQSKQIIDDARTSAPDFVAISIAGLDGRIASSTDANDLGRDMSSDADFVAARHEIHLGLPQRMGEVLRATLAGPMTAADGSLTGVVLVQLDMTDLEAALTNTIEIGDTAEVLVGTVRSDQIRLVLASKRSRNLLSLAAIQAPALAEAADGNPGFGRFVDHHGVEVLAAHQPVGYGQWGLIVKVDLAEVYQPIDQLRLLLMGIQGVLVLTALAASYLVARRVAQPILELQQAATAVAAGDLSVRVPLSSTDEIGALSAAFNRMTAELTESYALLHERVEQRTAELASANSALRDEIEAKTRMREAMVQSEKLASIGVLSAGIAHEINNPMAYVANNLAVLERDNQGLMKLLDLYESARDRLMQADPETVRRIDELAAEIDLPYVRENLARLLTRTRDGVARVARIVQTLRALARAPSSQLDEVQLGDLLSDCAEMVANRIKRREIRLDVDCDPALKLRCAASQVSQVVLNLLMNALQAVETAVQTGAGRIRIVGRRVEDELLIEVFDNGCGIEPGDLPRVFDPFFTTKPVGEGTGLGLSITHSIVAGHGGRIEIDSQPGQGSCFRIFLPQNQKETANDGSQEALPVGGRR